MAKKTTTKKVATKKLEGEVHQEAVLKDYEACVKAQAKTDKE